MMMSIPWMTSALVLAMLTASPGLAAPSTDCSKGPVPAGPAKGQFNGSPFVVGNVRMQGLSISHPGINGVTFDAYSLFFEQNSANNTTRYIEIDTIVPEGTKPDGRTFRRIPGETEFQPQITPGAPEVQGWSLSDDTNNIDVNSMDDKKGSLQIAFGKRKGKTLTGTVNFCTPSAKGTRFGGTFTFEIQE
jgi:hypothetical protein